MKTRDKNDLVTALVISSFAVFVIYEASSLPYYSEYGPGPGFLPLWLGMGIFVLALSLVFANLLGFARIEEGVPQPWTAIGRALGGWVGLMVAIALLPWVGFGLSFAFLTTLLILVLEGRSPLTALGTAVSLSLGFYLIFALALGVPLPSGPWGF